MDINKIPIADQLLYTTTRLEGIKNNKLVSTGTGFYYADFDTQRLFLVTNKHVIENTDYIDMTILKKNQKNEPLLGEIVKIRIPTKEFCGHYIQNIDITVANISYFMTLTVEEQGDLFYIPLEKGTLPTKEEKNTIFKAIENVVFVGYPNGLWDRKNGLPILRKGITASPCLIDFDGEKKFLIDASVFPGSSGSPVFLYSDGTYTDKFGNTKRGSLSFFLGVVAAVYHRQETGEIVNKPIQTSNEKMAVVNQMIDLGIVYKAETVLEAIENYHIVNKTLRD